MSFFSGSWIQSLLIHLLLVLFFFGVSLLLPKPKQIVKYDFSIQEKVIEAPKQEPAKPEALDVSQQKPVEEKSLPPVKKVFGINKDTITSSADTAVGVKTGNTVAVEKDNIESDGEALPVPVQEFLVTKMPKVKKEVRPPYPPEAKREGIEGSVIFEILIDANGKVREAKLIKGMGYGLDEAALEAIQQFEFEPAMMEQKPVAVRIKYAYRFVLD
ncbi:MAG: TonB family protein [Bdellovibrionia bacterium]